MMFVARLLMVQGGSWGKAGDWNQVNVDVRNVISSSGSGTASKFQVMAALTA